MGAIAYHLNKIMGKQNQKGTKSLTAQEMAVMSRRREATSENGLDDTLTLEDDTTASKRASGFGFFSWVGGLFSENIAFSFNGTQIKGKDKHQVRGGPVLLFRGAVLDLTPASMEGSISEDRQEVHPWSKGGTPAKLVVSPTGSGFMKEHKVDDFVMKAPKNGEVDEFNAVIREQVSYNLGDGKSLNASGAVLDQHQVVLKDPSVTGDAGIESAVINEAGLTYTKKAETPAQPEATGGGSEPSSADVQQGGEDASPTNTPQGTGNTPSANVTREEGDPSSAAGPDGESEPKSGTRVVVGKDGVEEIHHESEDSALHVNLNEGTISGKTKNMEGSADLVRKTFKFTVGKGWSSKDEEEKEKEKKDSDEDKTVTEALSEYYNKGSETAEFIKDALGMFFRTGELPENTLNKEKEKEGEGKSLKLEGEVMLWPGISFVASLEPRWSFGLQFGVELSESPDVKDIEVVMENGKVTKVIGPDLKRDFKMTAMASGEIGVTLRLALRAGVGYIFYMEGGLFADGSVTGKEGGNVFGQGILVLPVTLENASGAIKTGDASLGLKAGIDVIGKVGGDVRAASEIFDWENTLYSCTFAEWNPASFEGALNLKHDKSKGGFFNPLSWEKESSEFSIEAFGKHIANQKRYGLTMTDPTRVNMAIDASKALKDKLVEIHARLKEIEEGAAGGNGGGQFATQDSEAYKNLTKELELVSAQLKDLLGVGYMAIAKIERTTKSYKEDAAYLSNSEKVAAGIEKHENRMTEMEKWGKKFEGGREKERGAAAYEVYEKQNPGGKGVQREKNRLRENTARKSVASKDALLAYEKKRRQETGKKHGDRISILKKDFDALSPEERTVPNQKFLRKYLAMGAEGFLGTVSKHAGIDRLIKYEEGRLAHYSKKHKGRVKDLNVMLKEIPEDQRNKPNRAFVEYYYKEMNGKEFFDKEKLIYNHPDGRDIVDYEEERLKKLVNMDNVDKLTALKKEYDAAENKTEQERLRKAAEEYYKNNGGTLRLGHRGQRAIKSASAASKQEILDYEIKRLGEYKSGEGKKQTSYAAEKKAVELLGGVSATGGVPDIGLLKDLTEDEYKQVWNAQKKWIGTLADNDLKEIIPLQLMMEYEDRKVKSAGSRDSYMKHYERQDSLKQAVQSLEHEKNQETIDQTTKNAKEAYFAGEEGAKDLLRKVKKGEINDLRLLKIGLERRIESYGDSHEERVRRLREFMGLAADATKTDASSKSDAQVWEFYRKELKGGGGFAEYFKGTRREGYTIDDMLRFEQNKAREGSTSLKKKVKGEAEVQIADHTTAEGGEALKEKAKGGHYDRYMALKAKLDAGATDAEIVKLYKEELGGGSGYVKERLLKGDRFLDVVTPAEILYYESHQSGKKGKVHEERLEKLQEMKQNGTEKEAAYGAYQEMVLDKHIVKKLLNKMGIKQDVNFDGTVKPEEIATPQMIMDYETKRLEEKTAKHARREARLSGADVTDENALSIYQDMGGGDKFFQSNKKNIRKKKEEIGTSHDYEDIMEYEQGRLDFYKKIETEINEPLVRAAAAKEELKKQMDQMMEDQVKLQKYLGGNGVQEVFRSHKAFQTFAEESSGEQVQDRVENTRERVEQIEADVEEAQLRGEERNRSIEEQRLLEEDAS